MPRSLVRFLAGAMLALAAPAIGQTAQPPATPAQAQAQAQAPKLIVMISIDQFSGDLFNEYRAHFTGGLRRLQQGVVFPNAYQSHAATETCPGHSTILTGSRPARTGIIANEWFDQSLARPDKKVYCAEDTAVPGSSSRDYAASVKHLRVPTLGGYMKAADPGAKVIAVAGKDRAAIMMGGPVLDQIWWWGGDTFTSYRGTPATPLVTRVNAGVRTMFDQDRPAMALPALCAPHRRPIAVSPALTVGDGLFARKGGDRFAFRASPEADAAVLALAASLADEQKLGRGAATDLLIVGLSATDYVGHGYGHRGSEMCLHLLTLDEELERFFERLDASGVDYLVALTADHGGLDMPERLREQAMDDAARVDPALSPAGASAAIAARTGLSGALLLGTGPFGDLYVSRALSAADRAVVEREALAHYRASPQVAAVFTHAELAAAPPPAGPPEYWSLLAMAKASFDPARSGDLVVLLKPRIMPIPLGGPGYVATHGSPWDYDRRVPLLFWRRGLAHMEQPHGVETIDILPTLAAQIGLALPAASIDGQCRDLDPTAANSCPARQDR
jgi:predicted AlkP superfamily pyrophosphatase or phosphodiesterase